jgi:hypothetical protein
VYISGVANESVSSLGVHWSEAYLAKISLDRGMLWNRTFGIRRDAEIQEIVPLSPDDIVVVGKGDNRPWIARLSNNGDIIWDQTVGVGALSSADVAQGWIEMTAFEPDGELSIWDFDRTGMILNHFPVGSERKTLSSAPDQLLSMKTGTLPGTMWIFAALWGVLDPKPLKIIKLVDGHEDWGEAVPQTVVIGRNRAERCLLAVTVLWNGDPLIACSTSDVIRMIRLDGRSKQVREMSVSVPLAESCGGIGRPLTLSQESEASVLVLQMSPRCLWLGRISLSGINRR